jgi:hypothetical protein
MHLLSHARGKVPRCQARLTGSAGGMDLKIQNYVHAAFFPVFPLIFAGK